MQQLYVQSCTVCQQKTDKKQPDCLVETELGSQNLEWTKTARDSRTVPKQPTAAESTKILQ